MSTNTDLFDKQWCDLVFENKNKNYGAYELRKNDKSRTLLAMFLAISGFAAILGGSYLSNYFKSHVVLTTPGGEVFIDPTILPPVQPAKHVDPPTANPPKSKVTKHTEFKVVKNNQISETPPANDQITGQTGKVNVDGPETGNPGNGKGPETNTMTNTLIETPSVPVTVPDVMPLFPGGDAALFSYLQSNIKYPQIDKDNGISGTVFLTFVVGTDGRVTDINILRPVKGSMGLETEAIRVVSKMPQWTPGQMNKKAVPVLFTLPIKFSLR